MLCRNHHAPAVDAQTLGPTGTRGHIFAKTLSATREDVPKRLHQRISIQQNHSIPMNRLQPSTRLQIVSAFRWQFRN